MLRLISRLVRISWYSSSGLSQRLNVIYEVQVVQFCQLESGRSIEAPSTMSWKGSSLALCLHSWEVDVDPEDVPAALNNGFVIASLHKPKTHPEGQAD
ncbi:hypothetical protein MHYP_G00128550 [Metynnis hypsauchen]